MSDDAKMFVSACVAVVIIGFTVAACSVGMGRLDHKAAVVKMCMDKVDDPAKCAVFERDEEQAK